MSIPVSLTSIPDSLLDRDAFLSGLLRLKIDCLLYFSHGLIHE